MQKKRIYFYQLQGERNGRRLDDDEIMNLFKEKYNVLKVNSDGYKVDDFQTFDDYMIEYIDLNDDNMFVRIGKETLKNVIGKRDQTTGDLVDIELKISETIETYTYLYIDFNHCIMSFLNISGAPSRVVFNKYLNNLNEDISFDCLPISTKNILEMIGNKSVLGAIEYSYCKPKESVLYDIPGITDGIIGDSNVRKATINVRLTPPKNKSLFSRITDILNVKNDLQQAHGDNLIKLTIKARDEGEEMAEYNLMDYKFNSYVMIDMDNALDIKNFKRSILEAYNQEKSYLRRYIGY